MASTATGATNPPDQGAPSRDGASQQADARSDAAPDSSTSATAAPADNQLQEVVITVTKHAATLENTPQAITAASGGLLRNLDIRGPEGLDALVPSSRFEPFGAATHLYIRGIGSEQDYVYVNQLVAMLVDGVNLPRETTGASQFDVHQVEVLPGPQGTLYGANAVGGVVSIENNRPTNSLESSATLEAGNYGTAHGTLVENIPLSDTFWMRGAVDYNRHGDYESGGADSLNAFGGRLSALAKPTDNLTAYVWGYYYHDTGHPGDTQVVTGPGPSFANPSNPWDGTACRNCVSFLPFINAGPNRGNIWDYIVAGQVDYTIGAAKLSLIPSYLDSSSYTLAYAGPFNQTIGTAHQQDTTELRFTDDIGENLSLVSGLYWLKSADFQSKATYGQESVNVDNYEHQYAAYGQLTYSVSPGIHLIGGLRYGSQRKEDDFTFPALAPASATWNRLDWKAGMDAHPTKHTLLYASVQTGFAEGTFDPSNPQGSQPGYVEPTTLVSYTVGVKNQFDHDRIEVNDELFYYNYKNYLINTTIIGHDANVTTGLYTAPKVIDWGDQLDVRARVTDTFLLQASIGYLSAQARKIDADGVSYVNQTLYESPEWTAAFGPQQTWRLSNGATIVGFVYFYYNSGYWADFPHRADAIQPAFTKTNASLTYRAPEDRWTLGLYVDNLEGKAQLYPGAHVGLGVISSIYNVSPPRTFGGRFTVNFY